LHSFRRNLYAIFIPEAGTKGKRDKGKEGQRERGTKGKRDKGTRVIDKELTSHIYPRCGVLRLTGKANGPNPLGIRAVVFSAHYE
jgi:hypothetical protein